MIFVHDKGRMGNNLLQYGHVYAWAREHNRKSLSMRFAYKYPYFKLCSNRGENFLMYFAAKYAAKWGWIPTARFDSEDDTVPAELLMKDHRHIVVTGWYARWYDLFIKYKDEIRELFAFNDQVKNSVGKIKAKSVGLHIRRGDYKKWQGGKYYYSDVQYMSIVTQFLTFHPDFHVYICGNDPELDQDYFISRLGADRVTFPCGNPGEDLYLLSQCDYLIGAPSTFTLAASMYHDTPLYWIKDLDKPLTEDSFGSFDDLFRHIL